jgi:dsDNA-binding SOS-regulon protein
MAVECVYRSTRQPEVIFMTRSEADEHDRKLEVAENLSALIRHVLPSLSEDDAETLGIYMAERREKLMPALKKNPEAILELIQDKETVSSSVVPLPKAG